MNQSLDQLKAKLDRLSVAQRAELAHYLIQSLAGASNGKSAKKQLAQITPSNEHLRKLAAKHPPAQEWFEDGEERPF